MGEKRGKHTLPTACLTSRPSSPTAHSGLHSLHRAIIGQKDYDASISNSLLEGKRKERKEKTRLYLLQEIVGQILLAITPARQPNPL